MSGCSDNWQPKVGDRVATNVNGYTWTVDGFTTIVPGVVDVHLFDGRNYISRALGYVQRNFHPVPQQGNEL